MKNNKKKYRIVESEVVETGEKNFCVQIRSRRFLWFYDWATVFVPPFSNPRTVDEAKEWIDAQSHTIKTTIHNHPDL